MVRFAWDERKNSINRAKHGVWFEEAQSAFHDPHARMFYDPEHSEEEDRFLLLGMSSAGKSTGRGALLPRGRLPRSNYFGTESDEEGGASV